MIQIIDFINIAFQVLVYLIIARALLSFVRHNPNQPIIKFIYEITEPIMRPIRRLLPVIGGIDFSPIIAVVALEIIRRVVITLIHSLFGML